jgi:fucose permease
LLNSLVHFGFVVAGVATTLLGPILPILIARWSISDAHAGLFFTFQFCGNLVGIASLGFLLRRYGYRVVFTIGFALMAVGIGTLGVAPQRIGLLATGLYGYGLGLILPGTNLWVADIAVGRRAAALSLLNLSWGIGAIGCPVLVMLAERGHRLGLLFVSAAGSSASLALAFALTDLESQPQATARKRTSQTLPAVRARAALALGAMFFLYVGGETSVGGWSAALARRLGASPRNPWELAPLCFWAGLLGGRALGPLVLRRITERAMLTSGLMFAAVSNGTLLWAATFQSAAICLAAIGLGFACIYPLLVASLVELYGKQASLAGSVTFSLASLGGATLPWLVGFTSAKAGSLRAGLLIPLIASLVMVGLLKPLRDEAVHRSPS